MLQSRRNGQLNVIKQSSKKMTKLGQNVEQISNKISFGSLKIIIFLNDRISKMLKNLNICYASTDAQIYAKGQDLLAKCIERPS